MAEDYLIPVELKGILMDADWIYRTHGFLTRGVAVTNKIKAVKRGTKQVMMNYGAQRRFLNRTYYYKTWPCYLEWDGTLVSNPRTPWRAEVDEKFLCYVLGFYSIKYDHNGEPEVDENDEPMITYSYETLRKYLNSLKKCRTYTLVLSFDDAHEGDFYRSLKLEEPKHL